MTTQQLQNQAIQRTVLSNGITILVAENPVADIIAARLFIRAGSSWEAPQQAGLAHLLSNVITKGTEKLSSFEIGDRVESLGASLSTDAAGDYFVLSLKTVSADMPSMLELAGQILRFPTFPEMEVELERRLTLQGIRSQQEQPFTIAFDKLRQAMYQNHPYAMSALGTQETVTNLRQEDLQEFHQTHFRPDNVVISLAGRVSEKDAIAMIEEVFGDWQKPTIPLPTLNYPTLVSQPYPTMTAKQTQQSIVMLGYLAPAVREADYTALKLLSTYLGNGLSSRLFVELREKRGLAYDVSAFYPTRQDVAQFVVYMGTAPENTAIARAGLQTEIDLLCSAELSNEALQTAKNKLLGQYALGKQTNAQIAQVYGWYEIIGLGIEFDTKFQQQVAEVTTEDTLRAANRYFTSPYISIVGPETTLNDLAKS